MINKENRKTIDPFFAQFLQFGFSELTITLKNNLAG